MILRVEQKAVGSLRARLILVNGTNPSTGVPSRFEGYRVTASMTVAGQSFSYDKVTSIYSYRASTVLIDKTLTVSKTNKTFPVSASMSIPTGAYYLPYNGSFKVSAQYSVPKFQDSNGSNTSEQDRAFSLTWDVPEDSNGTIGSYNEYLSWRQVFWCGDWNQAGYIKLSFTSSDGKFLYGIDTIKRRSGTQTEYVLLATDGDGGYKKLKTFKFLATHEDKDNPFNFTRGETYMKRSNDKLTFHYWGKDYDFTVAEIKDKKSTQVNLAMGTLGNLPKVTHMYVRDLRYRKDNVSYDRDIPNRYQSNSKLVVNCEKDKVYYNGIEYNKEVVVGSDFLTIPPGDSRLEVYYSDWIEHPPEITVSFEERWL